MKLGKRLKVIDQLVDKTYDHIWDCCCDHGLLGLNLLARNAGSVIHFVDSVQALIDELSSQLLVIENHAEYSGQPSLSSQWQLHCISAEDINLNPHNSNLIIIAGVGGDLLIKLVNSIAAKYPNQGLDFILCPVHHNYKVRQALIDLKLGLVNEIIVKENKRFYEVIYVSTESSRSLSSVGSSNMWERSRVDGQEYLTQTLAHYRRTEQNIDKSARLAIQNIMLEYQALTILD